jgi:two-component system, NarL family, sensor histidine kinase UhpB
VVSLTRSGDDALVLCVSDDGRGMPRGASRNGGVRGMRERAVLVGGELEVTPGRDRGTTVRLHVPVGGAA